MQIQYVDYELSPDDKKLLQTATAMHHCINDYADNPELSKLACYGYLTPRFAIAGNWTRFYLTEKGKAAVK